MEMIEFPKENCWSISSVIGAEMLEFYEFLRIWGVNLEMEEVIKRNSSFPSEEFGK